MSNRQNNGKCANEGQTGADPVPAMEQDGSRLELATGWTVWHAPMGESAAAWTPPAAPGDAPMTGSLPMDVRTLLFRHGRCPDPRRDDASKASDWVVRHDWFFATTFELAPPAGSGTRVFLRTRGVDDLAEFRINGVTVGCTVSFNQLRYHDITAALRADGRQQLTARLRPYDPADLNDAPNAEAEPIKASAVSFKSCMFRGGDHNPFLGNAGFAMPPVLVVAEGALLESAGVEYAFAPRGDRITGEIVLRGPCWRETAVDAVLAPRNFKGKSLKLTGTLTPGQEAHRIPIPAWTVRRWEPFHLGFPHCYQLTLRAGGQELRLTTGFREFERRDNEAFLARPVASVLDWHPYENNGPYGQEYYKGYDALAEAGESWPEKPREGDYRYRHFINGRELFIMGGSVVPPVLFWSDWEPDYFRRLVTMARRANQNTLRIWGGGYVCDDAFFETADLLGVMIQHDFPNFAVFADRSYAFNQKKETEFRLILRQLQAHPSLVVMNGGNELLQMNVNRPLNPLFQTMARVVRQEAPNQFFHLSCPVNPEVHGPWFFGLDHAARYNSFKTIFNSECGTMALPALKSWRRALSPAPLADLFGPVWRHRMQDPGYFNTVVRMSALFGPPRAGTPGQAVCRTQLLQAWGYQYIAEEFRRQKPATSGFTTWEFNEPWLDMNWGILDHDLIPKASFWSMRRACAPAVLSARFGSYVVAPESPCRLEIWLSADGLPVSVQATARAFDQAGAVLGEVAVSGETDGDSVCLGEFTYAAPPAGVVFVRIEGRTGDGCELRNDYQFCVLPQVRRARPVRVLFLSGGCYESAVIHEYFKAAGFTLDDRRVSPVSSLVATTVDLAAYDVVVLGPIFNPLRSLGASFLAQLGPAVQRGLGLLCFPLNSSAYTSGRYDVDDLRGSPLEDLLPVTFADNVYRNSEDADGHGWPGKLKATEPGHPVWSGVDLGAPPDLGGRVAVRARPGAEVLATAGDEPTLVVQARGRGCAMVFTGPYGGHNYAEVGFRSWLPCHRLLANLVEFAGTGAVAEYPSVLHPLAPLEHLPGGVLAWTAERGGRTARCADWAVTVANAGPVPVLGVEIGCDDESEGRRFDWQPEENALVLLPGESRTIPVRAMARAGCELPPGLIPTLSAWNAASIRPLQDPMNHPATENGRNER